MSQSELNKRSKEEEVEMQDKYVKARIDGKSQDQAKVSAGYSAKTGTSQIERLGGPVHAKILRALEEHGINDDFLASEYVRGIELAHKDGAREKDLNAHAQYLRQLAFLMGYAKHAPSVAVQINNTTAPEGLDQDSIAELTRLIQEEISARDAGGIHEAGPGASDSQAYPGVDRPTSDQGQAGSGGQP